MNGCQSFVRFFVVVVHIHKNLHRECANLSYTINHIHLGIWSWCLRGRGVAGSNVDFIFLNSLRCYAIVCSVYLILIYFWGCGNLAWFGIWFLSFLGVGGWVLVSQMLWMWMFLVVQILYNVSYLYYYAIYIYLYLVKCSPIKAAHKQNIGV